MGYLNCIRLFFVVLYLSAPLVNLSTSFANPPLRAGTHDIDDTLLNLPTTIRLFKKGDPTQFVDVATSEFSERFVAKGDASLVENYQVIVNEQTDSFFRFRTADAMVEDLLKAIKENPNGWRGVELDNFMRLRMNPSEAALQSICSARALQPDEFLNKVLPIIDDWYLKNKGLKVYPLDIKNVSMVGNEKHIGEAKAVKINEFLDRIQVLGIQDWTYFDDDIKNIEAVGTMVKQKKERWNSMSLEIMHVRKGTPADRLPLRLDQTSFRIESKRPNMYNTCDPVFKSPQQSP